MRNLFLIAITILGTSTFAQEHFAGISTSSRVGLLNTNFNPAELPNLSKKFDVRFYGLSLNVANNKIGFSDLSSDKSFEELIFTGKEAVDLRFDTEFNGPGMAMKWRKWGFGLTTKAVVKFDMVDVDVNLGDALTSSGININGSTTISNENNQRLNGTVWGEVGLSAGRNVFDSEKHSLNAGIALKFLFPGTYSNLGADKFQGTITTNITGQAYLSNTNAKLNIAYSGNLADSFTDFNDYTKSIFGALNGVATDLGINYRLKDGDNKYKVNAGMTIRNIGSMTFKNNNNVSTNYNLIIPQATPLNPGLNLNQFSNVDNLQEVETILLNSGYLTKIDGEKDFKVQLPTVFSLYADIKIVPTLFVTGYIQRKLNNDNDNDQITAQNIFSVTPRVNFGFFETYSTWSHNDISGLNGGIGFRLGGFYLGSSSIITGLLSDSKQADLYTGFRWAFL